MLACRIVNMFELNGRVAIEIAKKTYSGTYDVSVGIITVRTLYGRKSTPVGQSPPEVLATIMLSELVWEGKADPDRFGIREEPWGRSSFDGGRFDQQ